MTTFLPLFLFGAALLAQTAPPTIPPEVQTEIALKELSAHLAEDAAQKAVDAAKTARAAAQASAAKGSTACGDKYQIAATDSKVVCVAKPEAPAK